MEELTLMEALREAGYPEEDFHHHCTDLYVYATVATVRVVEEWFKAHNLEESLFVSRFTDQITGRPMLDIAFQYDPAWKKLDAVHKYDEW